MDPFDTASSALILSAIYHSRKVIRPKAILTRTLHVLVVLSMLIPSTTVMAAPNLAAPNHGGDSTRIVELPQPSISESEALQYQSPRFEHPQPRVGRALNSPDLSSKERLLQDPTPTPTPDPDNPLLPSKLHASMVRAYWYLHR